MKTIFLIFPILAACMVGCSTVGTLDVSTYEKGTRLRIRNAENRTLLYVKLKGAVETPTATYLVRGLAEEHLQPGQVMSLQGVQPAWGGIVRHWLRARCQDGRLKINWLGYIEGPADR